MFYNIKPQSIYFCFCGTDQQENILSKWENIFLQIGQKILHTLNRKHLVDAP